MSNERKFPPKSRLVTIKVKPETYKRLKMYQAQLILLSGGEEAYTMDDVVSALMNFLEQAKVKFVKPKETKN